MFFIILYFVFGKFHAEEIQVYLLFQEGNFHSILASVSEGFVLPPIHLVCGNISADLSYFFISEKPLTTTTLFFLLSWLDSLHFLKQLVLGESVAVNTVHAYPGCYGWNGGEWSGVPQLFVTPAVPGLQNSMTQLSWHYTHFVSVCLK